MSYSSIADLRIQTPFKDSTLITDAYITQKISEADSIINAAIGETYDLPLASTPEIIENLSKNIATCLLLQEQNLNIEVQQGVSIKDFWDTQMSILESLRTRKLKLFDDSGDELALTSRIVPQFYPDEASETSDDPTAPLFTINQKF